MDWTKPGKKRPVHNDIATTVSVTDKWFKLRCNYLFGFLTENKQLLKLLFTNKRSPFRTKYKFHLVMHKTPNCNRWTIDPTVVPHFFNIFHRAKAWERTYTFVTSQFGITKKRNWYKNKEVQLFWVPQCYKVLRGVGFGR